MATEIQRDETEAQVQGELLRQTMHVHQGLLDTC